MEEVTELHPVPDAHVPVMKFKFQGIPIDLLYASISLLVVPQVIFCEFIVSFFVFAEAVGSDKFILACIYYAICCACLHVDGDR
jgi:hypothetical protein